MTACTGEILEHIEALQRALRIPGGPLSAEEWERLAREIGIDIKTPSERLATAEFLEWMDHGQEVPAEDAELRRALEEDDLSDESVRRRVRSTPSMRRYLWREFGQRIDENEAT